MDMGVCIVGFSIQMCCDVEKIIENCEVTRDSRVYV